MSPTPGRVQPGVEGGDTPAVTLATVAVIGAGAIGTAVTVELAAAARHPVLLCVRPLSGGERDGPAARRVELHRADANPIVCELTPGHEPVLGRTPSGGTTTAVADHPGAVGPADVVLLATKAHQSPGAKAWLDALVTPDTVVGVLQNGIDQVARISPLVPPGVAVVPVVVMMAVDRHRPDQLHQAGTGLLETPDNPAGRLVASLFDGTRLRAEAVVDFHTRAWAKLLINAVVGGIGALSLRGLEVLAEPDVFDLARALADEVVAVARAEGAALGPDDARRALERAVRNATNHWSSISVDRREGRPLEWQVRNAPIGELGRRHQVPTPLNDLVTTLLRACDPPV